MKIYPLLALLVMTAATSNAQTLNLSQGNVTYSFPASQMGDATYDGSSSISILGADFNTN